MESPIGLGERAVEQAEHVANVLRMRKVARVGLAAWPMFGLVDLYVVSFVHPGRLWYYLTLRGIGMLWIALAAMRVHAQPMPAPWLLRFMDVSIFGATSALISLTCLEFGGIASPLALGVVTVLVTRGAMIADHWRRSLLPIGLTVAAHPLALAGLALLVPGVGQQLHDPTALATFGLNMLFILGAGAISIVGGHAIWTFRREVLESRPVGCYRLKRRIGKGAMGEVWAAYHRALKRDVAVKLLRPGPRSDAATVARFEREVQTTAALTHPNTIRVFDCGVTDDGFWYYAMELLEGEDLGTLIRREGTLAAHRAAALVRQAACALAEAHERGLVHRDIKPENLFVTPVAGQGEMVKVLDFGLVRLAQTDDPNLTRDGWAVGTPHYVSPEVLQGQDAGPGSDIYALGVILYYALSGKPPFESEQIDQVMMGHLTRQPPPLSENASGLPPGLEAVVMRCLHKRPAERFSSALQLAEALRPFTWEERARARA